MPLSRIGVLGPLMAEVGDRSVDLGGARQRRLFAFLVMHADRFVSADELVEAVWDDADRPLNSDRSVRTYVSRLRRSFASAGGGKDVIHSRPPGYQLHLDGNILDANRLRDLLIAARSARNTGDHSLSIAHADAALALWRGRPYQEVADHYWAVAEVTRLSDLRAAVVEERVAALLDSGGHDRVLADLARWVDEHPWRERLREQLMVALYRAGRQAEALREFERFRTTLAEQTGLQPGPDLRRLERQILGHDPSLLLPRSPGQSLRAYRLIERVGEGAFAVVWRGLQPSLDREVAVKQIRSQYANNPEFIRRFDAEAHLIARLEHPHIVPLHDYWREPGSAYLVMRWLRGGTLGDRLPTRPLSVEEALRMVSQIGAALAAAHRAGIVHRDVKPDNIFLDGEGNYFLGDFGIALESSETSVPGTPASVGSPTYASPEQLHRRPLGPATDVWGLGISLYESLAGQLPFPLDVTHGGLPIRRLEDTIPSVRHVRADLPDGVGDVLAKATATMPEERYASIGEFVADFEAAISGRPASTARRGRSGGQTLVEGVQRNPYKGLRPFTEADAPQFFGRERLVGRLVERLGRPGAAGRFLLVVGPSGSGKSSVVRAGLIPALRRGETTGSDRWFVTAMVPGSHPFEELAGALTKVAVEKASGWANDLAAEDRGLARVVNQLLPDESSELVMVVDQLEEVFTLCDDEDERRRFLRAIAVAVTDPRSRLRVVASLRADFWDRPLSYPELAPLLDEAAVTVGPLAPDELEQAIVGPAAAAGGEFEPGLTSEIVADVADQPGALPMLQYALTELFDRQISGLLTIESYRSLGGVGGALARRADELYGTSTGDEQRAARRLFTQLTTLGEGMEDTRRRVVTSELGPDAAIATVIQKFGRARLLTFDHDPVTREPTVEVAHEALIRQWPRLREWLDDDREGLRLQRRLSESARSWDSAGRDASELYRGPRLDAAVEWSAAHPDECNDRERAFLAASVALRDADAARERREIRRLRLSVLGIGVALIVALVAGGIAAVQQHRASDNAAEAHGRAQQAAAERQRADEARQASDVRRLVAESKIAQGTDLPLSLLLAVEARRRAETPGTLGALQSALVSNPHVRSIVPGDFVRAFGTLTADGGEVLVGRVDGQVERIDTRTAQRVGQPLLVSEGRPVNLAVGADPSVFVALDVDGRLSFWDLPSATQRSSRLVPGAATANTTTNPPVAVDRATGEALVGVDGGVVIVSPRTEDPVRPLVSGLTSQVWQLAVSPDSSKVAIGTGDHAVIVVDIGTGQELAAFPTGLVGGTIGSLAWSPDGKRLGVGNGGSTGQLGVIVDASTGQQLSPYFTELPTPVGTYAADGSVYAHGSSNGYLALRDPVTGVMKEPPFPTFVGIIRHVFSSADGGTLYVVGFKGVAIVTVNGQGKLEHRLPYSYAGTSGGRTFGFDARTGQIDLLDPDFRSTGSFVIPGYRQSLLSSLPEFSPDGTALVAGSANGTITIMDVGSRTVRLQFPMPFRPPDSRFFATYGPDARNWVGIVRWSPDGRTLVAGTWDRVYFFDSQTGELRREVSGWKDNITWISFSPDGRYLLVGSFNGIGKVIDAATGEAVGAPLGADNFAAAYMSWTPDGHGIIVVDNGAKVIKTIDLQSRQLIAPSIGNFVANFGPPRFSDDGNRLLIPSSDGLVHLFDVATGQEVGDGFGPPEKQAITVAPGAGGQVFISRIAAPQAVAWEMNPSPWVEQACAAAGRNLTQAEWDRFLPAEGPRRPTCENLPL